MSAFVVLQLEVPLDPMLSRSFGDVMRRSVLTEDGRVMLDYEREYGVERGTEIGHWKLVERD